jgi:hypothetical protein
MLLARQMKVKQMAALIEADNSSVIRLFGRLELPTRSGTSLGETTLIVEVPE